MSNLLKAYPDSMPDQCKVPELARLGLQLLNMSIELLQHTQHDVATGHAQMARDTLLMALQPDIGFVAQLASRDQ